MVSGRRGWWGLCSSLCLSTPQLKPILADIEYLQDQHLLLTVKSMDGYESYGEEQGGCQGPQEVRRGLERFGSVLVCPSGECVVALKSMIGSTAQQFLTFLSHRGEETGNIRGSMKVRVPTERLGTRERLYGGGSIGRGGRPEVRWCGQAQEGRTGVRGGHVGIPGL